MCVCVCSYNLLDLNKKIENEINETADRLAEQGTKKEQFRQPID